MMIEPKESVTNIENVTSEQNNMIEQYEKVSNNQQNASNQNLNKTETTETSPSVFKLQARRNFNAILKQVETGNSGLSSPAISNLTSNLACSQQLRIVNSKITSIENVITPEPSIETKKPRIVVPNENPKFKKEDNNSVFTYNPINVDSDSLNCINHSYVKESHIDPRNRNSMLHLAEENTEVYRCYLCPYFNVLPDMIAQHWVLVHLPQKVYECPHCDQSFQTNFEVLCHLKLTHPLENHRVMIKLSDHFKNRVSFDFRKNLYLKEAEVEENEDKKITFKIKCHKCGLNCQSLNHLEEHLKQRHIRFKPFVCHLCYPPISFNSVHHLESHVEHIHPGYTFFDKNKTVAQNVYDMTFDTSNTFFCVGIYLNCINCPYKTISKGQMIFHLINKHDCPSKVTCNCCLLSQNLTLTEIEGERVVCRSCSSITNLHFRMPPRKEEKDSLFGCTICNITLDSKIKILRHLKFVHSNWKPFGCGYCDYAAVEKREVRCHLGVLHPSEPEKVVQLEEADSKMRKILAKMFDKVVKIYPKPIAPELEGFNCKMCVFIAKTEKDLSTHMLHKHNLRRPVPVRLPTEFYRCIICNYRCLDRSCMSRHAKYKHLSTRPHSCPYCLYNNVEKTKVRLHVMSHHPLLPKFVKTNKILLDQMSNEAKKFYVRCFTSKKAFEENISKLIEESPSSNPAPIVVNPNDIMDEDNEEKITENSFSDEDEFMKDEFENEGMLTDLNEVMDVQENEGVLVEVKKEKEDCTAVSIEDMGGHDEMMKTEMKGEVFEEINKNVDESDFNELFGLSEVNGGGIIIEKTEALQVLLENIKEEGCVSSVTNENAFKKELTNILESPEEGVVVERMDEGYIDDNSTMRSELNIEKGIKLKIKRMDPPIEEKSIEVFKDVVEPSFKIPKRDISILRRKKKPIVNNSTKIFESVHTNVSPSSTDNKLIDSSEEGSLSEVDTQIDVAVDDGLKENKKEDEMKDSILSKKDDNPSMDVHINKSPNGNKKAGMTEGIDIDLKETNLSQMFSEILKEKFTKSVDEKKTTEANIDNEVLEDPKISKMHPVVRLSRIKGFSHHTS